MIEIAICQTDPHAALGPLAEIITPPETFGDRRFFTDAIIASGSGLAPVFHTNRVAPSCLPLVVDRLERHPHAAQAFMPLDVSRYVVLVAPDTGAGAPDLGRACAVMLSGNRGILYRPGTWHMGMSVLDGPGVFAVLMWRGRTDDDVHHEIEGLRITSDNDKINQGRNVA